MVAGRDVEFPFPFEPYPIQKQLMQAIFDAIQAGEPLIAESPTGTVRERPDGGTVAFRRFICL